MLSRTVFGAKVVDTQPGGAAAPPGRRYAEICAVAIR